MNPKEGTEFETDNTLTEENTAYADTYDEKSGRSAVGRLFSEDDDTPKKPAARPAAAPDDYIAAISSSRQARADRVRPEGAAPAPVSRKIERTSVRNPEPKPAMRARVPIAREPVSARRVEEEAVDGVSIAGEVDSFKARYSNRDALATARDPAPADRVLHPVGGKSRTRAVSAPSEYAVQDFNPMRWVALAGVIVVLVIMIVLVVQNNRMSSELYDLRAAAVTPQPTPAVNGNGGGYDTPPPVNGTTEMQLQIESMTEQLAAANASIATLEAWVRTQGYDPYYVHNPPPIQQQPPPTTADDPPPQPPEPTYQVHYLERGQTLGQVATIFYGDWRLYTVIVQANNITNPNAVPAGIRLIIPPLP